MLFNSIQFLFFFIITLTLYFELPYRSRWKLLLLASCYFYMVFRPIYIFILGFTIVIDYFSAILIEKSFDKKRKWYLLTSLSANILILIVFKYWNFLNSNITEILSIFQMQNNIPFLNILLPIGLSFHTFQAMSYTIEVYKGNQKAERNFGIYSLYVMFFPQLVAGPIERPQNLLHQFYETHDWSFESFKEGIYLVLWGFFKKVVIADRLAIFVNEMYGNSSLQNGSNLLLATFFFTFQIYCDFSGYSDIAIGIAKIMGFDLMKNFDKPYFSKSIGEFWRRWHISLSTWFKDYLYIPLGGNKVTKRRAYLNIFIVFLVSGIWHGANWTFIAWGILHGLYVILDSINIIKSIKLPNVIKILFTFILVSFTWIFFRAENINVAITIIKKLFLFESYSNIKSFTMSNNEIYFSIILIIIIIIKEYYFNTINITNKNIFYIFSIFIIFIIYLFGVFNESQFIYFQF